MKITDINITGAPILYLSWSSLVFLFFLIIIELVIKYKNNLSCSSKKMEENIEDEKINRLR